jgi:hypothetical protein
VLDFIRFARLFRQIQTALLAKDGAYLKALILEAAGLADVRPDAEVVVRLWDAIQARDWVAVAKALSEFLLVVARILAVVLPLLSPGDCPADEAAALKRVGDDLEALAVACEAKTI